MSNQIQCKYSSNSHQNNMPMRISNRFSFLYFAILAASMLMIPSAESFCITQPTTIRSSTVGIQSASSATFSKPSTNFQYKPQSTSTIASATIDSPPSSSASEMSSFQKRMLERMNPTKKKMATNRNIPANLMKIETLLEYKKVVGGNTDKLIVVRFYAPWCKVRYRYFYIAIAFDSISNKKKHQDSSWSQHQVAGPFVFYWVGMQFSK